MRYIIKRKDGETIVVSGVGRHTSGNGNMYLWPPQVHGRDTKPLQIIPLNEILHYAITQRED